VKRLFMIGCFAMVSIPFSFGCADSGAPLQTTPLEPTPTVTLEPLPEADQPPAGVPLPEVGARDGNLAPDFMLTDLEGNEVLLSDLRGRVIFLNFWATWCPHCREAMASIERMYQEYKSQGFVVVAVNIGGKGETLKKVWQFATENNLTFPVLVDLRGKTKGPFKVTSLPHTYILDQEGIIRSVVLGARDWDSEENRRIVQDIMERDSE